MFKDVFNLKKLGDFYVGENHVFNTTYERLILTRQQIESIFEQYAVLVKSTEDMELKEAFDRFKKLY